MSSTAATTTTTIALTATPVMTKATGSFYYLT